MTAFAFLTRNASEPAQHEKRNSPRAHNNLQVWLTQDSNRQEGVSSDFSLTGLRLRLKQAVKSKLPVEVSLALPHDEAESQARQEPMRITGRIIWQCAEGDGNVCGIEFTNPAESQRRMIKTALAFLASNAEPEQQEKRSAPRAQKNLPARLIQEGNSHEGTSSDLSLTGLRLRLKQAVKSKLPVELAAGQKNEHGARRSSFRSHPEPPMKGKNRICREKC